MQAGETIFALATPAGRGALAVIRVSGPQAGAAVLALSGGAEDRMPAPRRASLRRLKDPKSGAGLDEALVLWMPGPRSFTGEDCAEFHVHGGVAVADSILTALGSISGLVPAEPGAFSRQAVLNGRMDLTAAEGIADLIDAETEGQQQQALRQMQGALGEIYERWRNTLTTSLAHIEADIEFAEEDLPGGLGASALDGLRDTLAAMHAHLAESRGERLRDGVSVAIIGPPNAGKSSLINSLTSVEAAIVSPEAGTTRDVVEVALRLAGVPVRLADTAGLREGETDVEVEGVRRARRRAREAELRILVTAPDALSVDQSDFDLLQEGDLWVVNKSDLADRGVAQDQMVNRNGKSIDHVISVRTGAGVSDLLAALEQQIARQYGVSDRPVMTRLRHRQALQEAVDHLDRAFAAPALELAAEDVRLASRALGRITGKVDVEALLDVVFNDFCIGK